MALQLRLRDLDACDLDRAGQLRALAAAELRLVGAEAAAEGRDAIVDDGETDRRVDRIGDVSSDRDLLLLNPSRPNLFKHRLDMIQAGLQVCDGVPHGGECFVLRAEQSPRSGAVPALVRTFWRHWANPSFPTRAPKWYRWIDLTMYHVRPRRSSAPKTIGLSASGLSPVVLPKPT